MALTTKEISKIQVLFAKADIEDFQKIADMFNTTRKMKERSIGSSFSLGQKVNWIGKRGSMTGTITKFNRKYIVVNAGQDGMWNVSPALLKAA
jgi:hypothetical protein